MYDAEEKCTGNMILHKCAFCGQLTLINEDKIHIHQEQIKKSCCHTIVLSEIPQYGSKFEGKEIKIPCCDDCLDKLVNNTSFEIQELIYGKEVEY